MTRAPYHDTDVGHVQHPAKMRDRRLKWDQQNIVLRRQVNYAAGQSFVPPPGNSRYKHILKLRLTPEPSMESDGARREFGKE